MAKVIPLPKRNVIKLLLDANHQEILNNKSDKNFLKEEYHYLYNRQNILKKQITIVQLLSDNNIKLFDEIKNIEYDKIKKLNLTSKDSVFYSALNFLPKAPNDEITGLPLFEKEEDRLQYINGLTNQELHKQYQDQINDLKLELKYIQKILKVIRENPDNTNISKFKTLPTYNGLGNTMTKPQHTLIADLIRKNKSENDKRILQEILAKHVMDDKDFTKEQKEEILQFIEDNKSNKVIENCLMFTLTKDENRVLRALREEIYEQIQTGQITASGVTDPQTGVTEPEVYIAHISYDKFFTLYGVSNDDKTTKHIKDILFGRSSKGLRKHIIVEDKQAISTQLILQIKEKKKKINLHKKEVETGFIITMPSFLFVGEDKLDAKNYYNQENEGHRRFIRTGRMAQSDASSNIICKLEMLCHSTLHNKNIKDKVVELNLETLVNIAGYQKRYKGMPKETKAKIDKILNNMIKTKYLIESFQLKKGKFGQEQYIIKPLKFIED